MQPPPCSKQDSFFRLERIIQIECHPPLLGAVCSILGAEMFVLFDLGADSFVLSEMHKPRSSVQKTAWILLLLSLTLFLGRVPSWIRHSCSCHLESLAPPSAMGNRGLAKPFWNRVTEGKECAARQYQKRRQNTDQDHKTCSNCGGQI